MVDCKCCKNLFGFAASRPPCVVFTVCLAAFAIGLFSLGYFITEYALRAFYMLKFSSLKIPCF